MGDLSDRMKLYESASRGILPMRMPVVVRVDGKSFSRYTSKLNKPFDEKFATLMTATAKELAKLIQGAQLAYTQSDEISILVHNYKKLNSSAWFDNQVQKMTSVAAAHAAAFFTMHSDALFNGEQKLAMFDARVFVLPEADVCNYFIWRQKDAKRNSMQMLARSLHSHNALKDKNFTEMGKMCLEKGHDWNAVSPRHTSGFVFRRSPNGWVGEDAPSFTLDRSYIEQLLITEE